LDTAASILPTITLTDTVGSGVLMWESPDLFWSNIHSTACDPDEFFRKLVEMTFGFKGFYAAESSGTNFIYVDQVNVPTLVIHPLVLITVNSAWF